MMRNNLNRNGSRRHSFRGHINSPFLRHRFAETTGDSLLPSLREAAAALCRSADRETLCQVIELLQRADPRNKLPPAPEPPASRVASREALALQTQTLGLGERKRRPSRSAGALASAADGAADDAPAPPASPRGYAQMLTDAATSLTSGAAAFLSPGPARPPSPPDDDGGEKRSDARDRAGSAGSKLGGDPEARRQRRVEALLGEIDAPGDRMRRASSTPLLSALAAPPAPSEDDGRGSPARQPSMSASCAMLRELARAPATVKLGLDLGGTLTKLVIATPVSDGGGIAAPRRAHERLRLHCDVGGVPMTLQFVSSSTGELEEVLTALGCSDDEDESARRISRRIVAAGGGAHKLRQTFRSALGIELTPFREMQSIVDGILLLHELGVDDELYTASDTNLSDRAAAAVAERADGRPVFRPADPLRAARAAPRAPSSPPTVSDARACEALAHWPKPLLPLLLVNVGSGVSCLLVSREGYARVGGTALRGAGNDRRSFSVASTSIRLIFGQNSCHHRSKTRTGIFVPRPGPRRRDVPGARARAHVRDDVRRGAGPRRRGRGGERGHARRGHLRVHGLRGPGPAAVAHGGELRQALARGPPVDVGRGRLPRAPRDGGPVLLRPRAGPRGPARLPPARLLRGRLRRREPARARDDRQQLCRNQIFNPTSM